jgi:hypothetical protein
MSLNVKKIPKGGNGGNRVKQPLLEPGTSPGRTVQIIDLGLQPQRAYQGQEKAPAHEIMLTYELLDTFMVDENGKELEDKPRWVSETIPLRSLDNDLAKSTKRYNALDPEGDYDGDFSRLVDIPCNITIALNQVGEKTYENISNVSTMRAKDAAKAPELKNPTKVFLLDEPDLEVYNSLPEWLREKISSNLEYKGSALQKLLESSQKPSQGKGATIPKGTYKKGLEELTEAPDYDQEADHDAQQTLGDDNPW